MKPQVEKWAHLAPNPKSAYKQLFVKGTRIRARVIYGLYAMKEDPLTPEQIAEQFDLPVERSRRQLPIANPIRRSYWRIMPVRKLLWKPRA
jgi:uncharacterized protein (DUF433 family)